MYVSPNVKSKAELKRRIAAGESVTVFSPGPFPAAANGTEFVEGPHYPKPHTWYAQVEVKAGRVVKVVK
jgi:hypothetical protein